MNVKAIEKTELNTNDLTYKTTEGLKDHGNQKDNQGKR